MKIIIDIPDNIQEMCQWHKDGICSLTGIEINIIAEAIVKGMAFPDNATNGDTIKAICPMWINYHDTDVELIINNKDWNALYKAGDTDGRN